MLCDGTIGGILGQLNGTHPARQKTHNKKKNKISMPLCQTGGRPFHSWATWAQKYPGGRNQETISMQGEHHGVQETFVVEEWSVNFQGTQKLMKVLTIAAKNSPFFALSLFCSLVFSFFFVFEHCATGLCV